MVTAFLILGSSLVVGQVPDRSGWQLSPQLFSGLELAYSGTYSEEALIPGVQCERTYRLENTVFVMESSGDRWNVAVLTVLGLKNARTDREDKNRPAPSSVRLELAQVDRKGRILGKEDRPLSIPLSGPPTLEIGAILELPSVKVGANQLWEVGEEGQPPRTWQVVGPEACSGTTCVKLQGQQQSDDWDRPRADHVAWRRRDTVWLSPQLGIAYRVERVIERREPARRDPSFRSVVRYELDSRLRYPGRFFDDRQEEIRKALKFHEEAVPLLADPTANRPHIDALSKKIAYHVENSPATQSTPYRKAVLHVQNRLEQARRGEFVLEPSAPDPMPLVPTVRLGQRAPDFLVSNLTDRESVRLYRHLGRPVLIAFYNPASDNGRQVLDFAKGLSQHYGSNVGIMAMAVSADAELVRRQHAELHLPFPILDGNGMHLTFGVEATPRLVLLDGEGTVRGAYTGWGMPIAREIESELKNWLPR